MNDDTNQRPKIAVSACLLGHNVRYNGQNTLESWLVDTLSDYVDFVHFCPEVEMGLGIPREEIHLFKKLDGSVILRSKKTQKDLTPLAYETYEKLKSTLSKEDLNGFIMMKKSPSCAFKDAKMADERNRSISHRSSGLFTDYLMNNFIDIPLIDSGRLRNELMREHFIKLIYAHHRFSLLNGSISELQNFHKKYKYILMEHNQAKLKPLGKIAANSSNDDENTVYYKYKELFFEILRKPATNKARVNVMEHVMGYLKKYLDKKDKANFLEILNQFRNGIEHYMVPIQMLKFFIDRHEVEYFQDNFYFSPYPIELKVHKVL